MMTSVLRVGQSKFVNSQIDEDSYERIMNCIITLSEVTVEGSSIQKSAKEIFLDDTKTAYGNMISALEVRTLVIDF